jgi:glutamyl-Q tRNA(Asp) synthetase
MSAAARNEALVRGRFAPSPTGPLHFGSLVAAVGSFLHARSREGEWLVRMEDLDRPREVAGAAGDILRTLEAHGLEWDGPVRHQRCGLERYAGALERLIQRGLVYPCACTRREISDSALQGIDGAIYPGTCRRGLAAGRSPRSWRVRVPDVETVFIDEAYGRLRQAVASEVGDFVLKRADGLFAYQLAVVVDDADQGITEVVRGADLLDSTARQIVLQQMLGLPQPSYLHLPVAVNPAGEKLSKQTLAPRMSPESASLNLLAVLNFLGQAPSADLRYAPAATILAWAIEHWNARSLPRVRTAPAP